MSQPVAVALIAFFGTVVSALFAWAAAALTAKRSRESTEASNIYNRVDTLERRVDALEKEREEMREERFSFITLIEALYTWVANGCEGSMPLPAVRIQGHIDPTVWKPSMRREEEAPRGSDD